MSGKKKEEFHILNGDMLARQFPKKLSGKCIVFRECLVDGPVKAASMDEFYRMRAEFISQAYKCIRPEEYFEKTVPEIIKILSIPRGCDINLWFEDDLFCQVNFWFLLDKLYHRGLNLYLVRPEKLTCNGFGCYDEKGLEKLYSTRITLDKGPAVFPALGELWKRYESNDLIALENTASSLKFLFPFIFNAVQAHIERQPSEDYPGRPVQSLRRIMDELGTSDFGPVFKEFCKREYIYGFGDLQVKRLLKSIQPEDIKKNAGVNENPVSR